MKKTKKKSVSPRADRQACRNRTTSSDVTGRRQVEAAWRDSEARFRAVAENTPDHVLVQDKDLRYRLVVNPQMGFTEQQLLGKTDHDLIPPRDAAVLTRLKRRVLKTGKAVHVQVPVTSHQGETQYFEGSYVPRRDARGRVDGIIGYFRNVTDRKRAEEEVRQLNATLERRVVERTAKLENSEAQFRALIQASSDVVYRMSADWREMRHLVGREFIADTHEPSRRWLQKYIFPEDQPHVMAVIQKAIRGKSVFELEHRVRRADGSAGWTFSRAIPVLDAKGRVVEWFGMASDVTARKQAEETVRESRATLQGFYDSAPFLMGIAELHGDKIVAVSGNRAVAEFFRQRPEELSGKTGSVLGNPVEFERLWVTQYRRSQRVGAPVQFEYAYPGATGACWLSATVVFIGLGPTRRPRFNFVVEDITARKQAELALRENEEKYRSLFENMAEIFQVLEPIFDKGGRVRDFRYIKVNRATEILTGKKQAKIEGKTARELWGHVEDYWLDMLGQTLKSNEPVHMTNYSRELDAYYDVHAWKTDNHNVAIIASNITAIKRAEAASQRSEAELREGQRMAHIGSWYWDATTDVTTGSDELLRIFGFDPAKQTMPNFQDQRGRCYPVEDWERLNAAVQQTLKTGVGYELEMRAFRDGTPIWITTRSELVRDASGKTMGLRGTVQDITEHKQADLMRARLAAIVESSTDAITAMDLNGVITDWTASAERLYGYTAAEAVGQPIGMIVPPDKRADIPLFLSSVARGERFSSYETVRFRKDGQRIDVSLTISPVRDRSGRIVGSSAITRDISERKRLEAEVLRISEIERQRLGRDLHDGLSQHLAAMAMMCVSLKKKLAAKHLPEAAEAHKLIQVAQDAAKASHDLSRALYPATLHLTGLATALQELALFVEKMFPIRCRFRNQTIARLADANLERQLFRIAQEAAFNAAKHSKGRHVWITLRESPRLLTLTIKDDGVGSPVEKLLVSDLGISIMQYRANLIHASLTIDAKPDRGTIVTCKLRKETR